MELMTPSQMLVLEVDIIMIIHYCWNKMSTRVDLGWVRKHQDKGWPAEECLSEAQMNIKLD